MNRRAALKLCINEQDGKQDNRLCVFRRFLPLYRMGTGLAGNHANDWPACLHIHPKIFRSQATPCTHADTMDFMAHVHWVGTLLGYWGESIAGGRIYGRCNDRSTREPDKPKEKERAAIARRGR